MKHEVELGKLIEGEAQRDAVHVAIAPVVAAEKLSPGQDVGFVGEDKSLVGVCPEPIGIVDPFLKTLVFPDQRFYVWLYPRTITSLRHDWTHPAFSGEPATEKSKEASERWLREFVASMDCPDYETLIAAATGKIIPSMSSCIEDYGSAFYNDGAYLHFNGRGACGEIPPEFWDHIENVTGQKICDGDRARHFSCSC